MRFWWKVKRFSVGFQILQISHKSKLSISSIIFPIDFFFRVDFPPFASNLELKWKLKSLPIITFLFPISTFYSILCNSVSVRSCSGSVLQLQIFIKTNLTSSTKASISKRRPFLSAV